MKRNTVEYKAVASAILSNIPNAMFACREKERVWVRELGWGSIGRMWGRDCFYAYIHDLDEMKNTVDVTGVFSICFDPTGVFSGGFSTAKIIEHTPSALLDESFRTLGCTAVRGRTKNCCALSEYPLTIECRVIARNQPRLEYLEKGILARLGISLESLKDCTDTDHGYVTEYVGEIVDSYMLKPGKPADAVRHLGRRSRAGCLLRRPEIRG